MTEINFRELSPRAQTALQKAGITTLEALEMSSQYELRSIAGTGPKTVRDINRYYAAKTGRNLRTVPLKRKDRNGHTTKMPIFATYVEDAPEMVAKVVEAIFVPGECVTLRSGGPAMTVMTVHDGEVPSYDLVYFADGLRVAERVIETVLTAA